MLYFSIVFLYSIAIYFVRMVSRIIGWLCHKGFIVIGKLLGIATICPILFFLNSILVTFLQFFNNAMFLFFGDPFACGLDENEIAFYSQVRQCDSGYLCPMILSGKIGVIR